MKANIKKRWIKALRSGKYKQGKGRLRNEKDEFCCLGVFCDITKDETGGKWGKKGYFGKQGTRGDDCGLPPFVTRFLGMDLNGYTFPKYYTAKGRKERSLIGLNDSGASFKQIANIIDKNF